MLNIIKDHIEYRYQILKLAWFDTVKQYKGTVFGWVWIIVKPATTILVFWFAFTYGFRTGKPVDGFPFIIWLISGILPWFFMSDILNKGIGCIRGNSYLVNKIKFPISVIPTFDTLAKIIPHTLLLLIFMVIYGIFYGFDIFLLQLPFYYILMFSFFSFLSLGFSLLSAISKDFLNLVKAFTTAIFWLSGIIWNIHTLNVGLINKILLFNPVTFFAESYRNVFIYKTWFFNDKLPLICFLLVFLVTIVFSLWIYRKTKNDVGDVL